MHLEYYWKKKTIVAFLLSVMVTWIHTSSFEQYTLQLPYSAGFSELAVFLGNLFQYTVCRVAVPLFFILAGANLFRNYSRENYKEKMLSRVKSLVVPYLVWNTLVMLFYIATSYTFISEYFTARAKFELTFQNVLDSILFRKCNYVFWFMYDLIIYTALTPVFHFLTSRKWAGWVFAAAALALPLLKLPVFGWIGIQEDYLVYYVIGCVIGKYYFLWFTKKSAKNCSVAAGLVCLGCMAIQMLSRYILSVPETVMTLLVIVFAFSFWVFMDLVIPSVRVRTYMGFTMFIYAMHPDVSAIFAKLIYLIGPKKMWMAFPNFLLTAVLTVVSICVFAWLVRKVFPKGFAVLTGFRNPVSVREARSE